MSRLPQKNSNQAWRKCRLGDVLTLINGRAYSKHEERDAGTPVLRIQNLNGGDRWFYSDLELPASKYCDRGDLLFAWSATFGPYIYGGPRSIYHYHIWKVECGPLLDKQFAYYLLKEITEEVKSAGRGIAMLHMTKSGMEDWEVEIPPLEEQKRIAAILDQANELRRKRQRALDRLNQLGQAIFIEMFGDPKTNPKGLPWTRLGDVADFYSGNSLPEGEPFSGQYDGHLLLKVSDLNHPLNQHDILCAASWSAAPGSRAETCPPDALIFPKRGGAIGTNKKRWLRRSAILDPNLMGVHPDQNCLTMSFLCGWFDTFNLSDIASGSSVPQLNKQDLAPLQLALPPIEEQVAFAERMEEITALRHSLVKACSCDIQLFEVLQHRAFRGEL